MKRIVGLGLLVLLTASHAHAASTLTQWGAIANSASSTCASDFCGADTDLDFLLNLAVAPIDGGLGQTSAGVSTGTWPSPGSAQAEGTVAGGLAVPKLTAGAASGQEAWIAGQALVIQGYDYTGTGPETIELNWSLSGNVTNPDNDPLTGLTMFVGFYGSSGFAFPGTTPTEVLAVLSTLADASTDGNVRDFTTSGAIAENGTASIEVNDGDQFYLAMGLMASAGGSGAVAESLSTLKASFTGDPPLSPAITTVPAPAAAWLLGSGLLGLAGTGMRRRRA